MSLKNRTTPIGKVRELTNLSEAQTTALATLSPIATPATATTETIANAHNALLAALKG